MDDRTGASSESTPERKPSVDDTAAFQRYYDAEPPAPEPQPSLLYRLFVGWWRRPTSSR